MNAGIIHLEPRGSRRLVHSIETDAVKFPICIAPFVGALKDDASGIGRWIEESLNAGAGDPTARPVQEFSARSRGCNSGNRPEGAVCADA